MYYYDFRIANLLLRVESPLVIPNFFELCPFRVGDAQKQLPDAVYQIVLFEEDIEPVGKPLYQSRQTAVYQTSNGMRRYFYWDPRHSARYVMLEQPDMGKCILYIRKAEWNLLVPQLRLSAFFSMERLLLKYEAFQLHASVIQWNGQGILFSAPSGTGKSTQAQLWHTYTGAEIINGDRGLIRREEKYRVYGAPYAGSSGIYNNRSVPILAVVTLEQGNENKIRRLTTMEAFQKLYREITVPVWDEAFVDAVSKQLLELLSLIPVYHLICKPDREAVDVLFNVIKTIC